MNSAIPVNAFVDNYIWLVRIADASRVAIVDPGDAKPVLAKLASMDLTPVAILLTHHHFDHIGGVGEILQHYSIPVYGPRGENIPVVEFSLKNNDAVSLENGDLKFEIIDVPGHTRGHIAYYRQGMLLCGDTLFALWTTK